MSDAFETFDASEEILAEYAAEWNLSEGFDRMKAAREANDEKGLIKAANEVWFALPDRKAIRTRGFFALCDIAENIFEEEPEA